MANTPITPAPLMGHKVEAVLDKDGYVIPPSTLANEAAEDNKGRNPDYFGSIGGSMEQQNDVGKGANPSADVTTKNDTTIDPVRREPSPTADDRVVPKTVPASLPANAPITEPDGSVHAPGEEPKTDATTPVTPAPTPAPAPAPAKETGKDKPAKEEKTNSGKKA